MGINGSHSVMEAKKRFLEIKFYIKEKTFHEMW